MIMAKILAIIGPGVLKVIKTGCHCRQSAEIWEYTGGITLIRDTRLMTFDGTYQS